MTASGATQTFMRAAEAQSSGVRFAHLAERQAHLTRHLVAPGQRCLYWHWVRLEEQVLEDAGEPRVAVSRLVRAGEPAAEVTARLRADPALSWATTLLVQTQPTRTDRATHLRTLDVGGDKPLSYLPLPKEENPFLGLRGIRVSLDQPAMFRTQLRAILRAATLSDLHIMFPMIATLE